MATGDQSDFINRLQRLMPPGWFAQGATPIRDALLAGIANAFAFVFSLFVYLKLQTRIATATDGWLDLIAFDFFRGALPRGAGQLDPSYKARIQASLFPKRNTRAAIIGVLTQITGRVPIGFEPGRAADSGGYSGGAYYGVAGGYGSTAYPYQSFVTAFRPLAGTPQFGISDADIYAAIESVRMGGTKVWIKILS